MKQYRISAVSYYNTYPFIYGLQQSGLEKEIDLQLDIPSECAGKLLSGKVDIGLIPVAVIPNLAYAEIIAPYGIAADGKVDTVCLLSEKPLNEMSRIILDYQSKTSVKLLQVILKHYWKLDIPFVEGYEGYEDQIKGETSGLVIGNRVFDLEQQYLFKYDLAAEWKKMTGLPFVFAAWVSNKPVDEDFKRRFSAALAMGVNDIDRVMDYYFSSPEADVLVENPVVTGIEQYLKNTIKYRLTEDMKKGMARFLKLISEP